MKIDWWKERNNFGVGRQWPSFLFISQSIFPLGREDWWKWKKWLAAASLHSFSSIIQQLISLNSSIIFMIFKNKWSLITVIISSFTQLIQIQLKMNLISFHSRRKVYSSIEVDWLASLLAQSKQFLFFFHSGLRQLSARDGQPSNPLPSFLFQQIN